MATVQLTDPVHSIHGRIAKDHSVHRRKTYRDEKGNIIGEGKQEQYDILNPRNYKKHPPKGTELANINRWQEACHRTTQILQVAQPEELTRKQRLIHEFRHVPTYYTPEEAQELYNAYQVQFKAQLSRKVGKHYLQFSGFVRAMIYQDLKSAETQASEPTN